MTTIHTAPARIKTTCVCSTFRRLSFQTWDFLESARSVDYQPGEETITDVNVLELKKRISNRVVTHTFSKPDEGKNGADWEWWFTGPSGLWFGIRVQAKVLKLEKNEFEHLHYKGRRKVRYQSDRLIRSALSSNVPLVPLYCLYSHWPADIGPNLFTCEGFGVSPDSFGCSLISAFDVQQLRLRKMGCHLETVMEHAYPWHCLVCCESEKPADLPTRAHAYWKNVILANQITPARRQYEEFSEEMGDARGFIERYYSIEPTQEPPTHVSQLLSRTLRKAPDRDIGGIVVLDETGELVT